MRFISTRNHIPSYSLREALFMGLAPDGGLFMPEVIPKPDREKLKSAASISFACHASEQAIPYLVEDMDKTRVEQICSDAFNFPLTLRKLNNRISVLELFHGPTLAFKDFGARFMARLMAELLTQKAEIIVLVATSGDTGGAVAAGFYDVPGIKVVVLYPDGRVSEFQEKQFAGLGRNITCLAVDGSFDDCQKMVKSAFNDMKLRDTVALTSANSINIGRWIPQSFYYNYALDLQANINGTNIPVLSVPSGNYGNLTAGMMGAISSGHNCEFIAASNINDTVPEWIKTGIYRARSSRRTIANAMDVGDPSNFERMLALEKLNKELVSGLSAVISDDHDIRNTISYVFKETGYIADPHTATAFRSLKKKDKSGIVIATAHPVKFIDAMPDHLRDHIAIPEGFRLPDNIQSRIKISNDYDELRELIISLP